MFQAKVILLTKVRFIRNPIAMSQKTIFFLLLVVAIVGCAPYANGPVFRIEDARSTFGPILDFMEAKRGMAVADVGAGSGALTVIMATQRDSCTVYIQDIDQKILAQENVNKMVAYYSKKLGYDLGKRNTFHITHGALSSFQLA